MFLPQSFLNFLFNNHICFSATPKLAKTALKKINCEQLINLLLPTLGHEIKTFSETAGLVFAKITNIQPIPHSRNKLCRIIYPNQNDVLVTAKIVCGADNLALHQIVVYAPTNSLVQNHQLNEKTFHFGSAATETVTSPGMLCSWNDLIPNSVQNHSIITYPDFFFQTPCFINDVIYELDILWNRNECNAIFYLANDFYTATHQTNLINFKPTMEAFSKTCLVEPDYFEKLFSDLTMNNDLIKNIYFLEFNQLQFNLRQALQHFKMIPKNLNAQERWTWFHCQLEVWLRSLKITPTNNFWQDFGHWISILFNQSCYFVDLEVIAKTPIKVFNQALTRLDCDPTTLFWPGLKTTIYPWTPTAKTKSIGLISIDWSISEVKKNKLFNLKTITDLFNSNYYQLFITKTHTTLQPLEPLRYFKHFFLTIKNNSRGNFKAYKPIRNIFTTTTFNPELFHNFFPIQELRWNEIKPKLAITTPANVHKLGYGDLYRLACSLANPKWINKWLKILYYQPTPRPHQLVCPYYRQDLLYPSDVLGDVWRQYETNLQYQFYVEAFASIKTTFQKTFKNIQSTTNVLTTLQTWGLPQQFDQFWQFLTFNQHDLDELLKTLPTSTPLSAKFAPAVLAQTYQFFIHQNFQSVITPSLIPISIANKQLFFNVPVANTSPKSVQLSNTVKNNAYRNSLFFSLMKLIVNQNLTASQDCSCFEISNIYFQEELMRLKNFLTLGVILDQTHFQLETIRNNYKSSLFNLKSLFENFLQTWKISLSAIIFEPLKNVQQDFFLPNSVAQINFIDSDQKLHYIGLIGQIIWQYQGELEWNFTNRSLYYLELNLAKLHELTKLSVFKPALLTNYQFQKFIDINQTQPTTINFPQWLSKTLLHPKLIETMDKLLQLSPQKVSKYQLQLYPIDFLTFNQTTTTYTLRLIIHSNIELQVSCNEVILKCLETCLNESI